MCVAFFVELVVLMFLFLFCVVCVYARVCECESWQEKYPFYLFCSSLSPSSLALTHSASQIVFFLRSSTLTGMTRTQNVLMGFLNVVHSFSSVMRMWSKSLNDFVVIYKTKKLFFVPFPCLFTTLSWYISLEIVLTSNFV